MLHETSICSCAAAATAAAAYAAKFWISLVGMLSRVHWQSLQTVVAIIVHS